MNSDKDQSPLQENEISGFDDSEERRISKEKDQSVENIDVDGNVLSQDVDLDEITKGEADNEPFSCNINVPRSKINFKTLIYTILGFLLTAMLIWGSVYLATPNKRRISRWVRAKSYDKLDDFLDKSPHWLSKDGSKKETYIFALAEAINAAPDKFQATFFKMFAASNSMTRIEILESLNKVNTTPDLLAGCLSLINTSYQGDGPESNLFQKQIALIKDSIGKLDPTEADQVIIQALWNRDNEAYNVDILVERSNRLKSLVESNFPRTCELYGKISSYDNLRKAIQVTEDDKNDKEEALASEKHNIQLMQDMEDASFYLRDFWVVQQVEENKYEIVPFTDEPYVHAVLYTSLIPTTTLRPHSYASMKVVRCEDVEVQVGGESLSLTSLVQVDNVRNLLRGSKEIASMYESQIDNCITKLNEYLAEKILITEEIYNILKNR